MITSDFCRRLCMFFSVLCSICDCFFCHDPHLFVNILSNTSRIYLHIVYSMVLILCGFLRNLDSFVHLGQNYKCISIEKQQTRGQNYTQKQNRILNKVPQQKI